MQKNEILNNSLYEFFKDFEISVKHPKLNKLPENWKWLKMMVANYLKILF